MATPEAIAKRLVDAHSVGYKFEPWRERMKFDSLSILKFFKQVMEQHSIPYFIVNGTLLGALKYTGQIAHDDDIDIGCFIEDMPRITLAIQQALSGTPYRMIDSFYGKIIYGSDRGMLDILVFTQHVDGRYKMAYPLANGVPSFWMSKLRKYDFSYEELLPLRKYNFEDFDVWGPASGTEVCLRVYGKDVFEVCRRPDGGMGVHIFWPQVTKAINPLTQGIADMVGKHFPGMLNKKG